MIKIEFINLPRLRNNEHYQFMSDVDLIIMNRIATELGLDKIYPEFKNALSIEENAMRVEQGSSKSEIIEDFDTKRDNTWNAINTKVKAALLSPFDDEFQSAIIIKRTIELFDDPRTFSYNEETAALNNLIEDLQLSVNIVHLEKIGITAWVNELKKQNEKFQQIFNERISEYAGRESGDVRATRKIIDPLYERITDKINASVVLETAGPNIETFINELNEKIKYYKTTIAVRVSRQKVKNTPPEKV